MGLLLLILFTGLNSFEQDLYPVDFQKKIKELPKASIVDVRTPGEFNQSHIKNAINININDNNFINLINKLDKNKPVLVYCLSGSRSAYAVYLMQNQGFKVVYNLSGGMMKWRAAGLPETTSNATTNNEMSLSQLNNIIKTDKLVLVDFFAEWCKPCKIQAPILTEIAGEMKNKVDIIKVDVDKYPKIVSQYRVQGVPTLVIFKNGKIVWQKSGLSKKEELKNTLQNYL